MLNFKRRIAVCKTLELSQAEYDRYSRHLALPEFKAEHQQKLKLARVAVVGAGGLGSPVLQYLAAAGIGKLTIIDNDTVSISNLQRQILYATADIGKSKAQCAADRVSSLNPLVDVVFCKEAVHAGNAEALLAGHDVLVDCTDNFASRYLLNDCSVLLQVPLVYGSLFRWEGQVAVFNFDGSVTYRDLYPAPPLPGAVPDCEEAGVVGALAGIIGCVQANEVIKITTGLGKPVINRLLIFDALQTAWTSIGIPDRKQRAVVTQLIDYADFCGIAAEPDKENEKTKPTMKEVTVQELKTLMDNKAAFQLIDVRELHEYDTCNLGGELIPMAEVPHRIAEISKDKQVIMHCRSGKRSGDMINWLEKNHGFENLYNLRGGILAWAKEIDTSMPTY